MVPAAPRQRGGSRLTRCGRQRSSDRGWHHARNEDAMAAVAAGGRRGRGVADGVGSTANPTGRPRRRPRRRSPCWSTS